MAARRSSTSRNAPASRQSRPCTSPLPNLSFVTYFANTPCDRKDLNPKNSRVSTNMSSCDVSVVSLHQQSQVGRAAFSSIPRLSSDKTRSSTKDPTPAVVCSDSKSRALGTDQREIKQKTPAAVPNEQFIPRCYLSKSLLPSSRSLTDYFEEVDDQQEQSSTRNKYRKAGLAKSCTSSSLGVSSSDVIGQYQTQSNRPAIPRFATQVELASAQNICVSDLKVSVERNTYSAHRSNDRQLSTTAREKITTSLLNPKSTLDEPSAQRLEIVQEDTDPRYVSWKQPRSFTHVDILQVYSFQPVEYWLGRYIAQGDRRRSNEHQYFLQKLNHHHNGTQRRLSTISQSTTELDNSDAALRRRTLEALRDLCMTSHALIGLEQFEDHLYRQYRPARAAQQRGGPPAQRSSDHRVSSTRDQLPPNPRKADGTKSSSIFRKPSAYGKIAKQSSRAVFVDAKPVNTDNNLSLHSHTVWKPANSHRRTSSWRSADFERNTNFAKAGFSRSTTESGLDMCSSNTHQLVPAYHAFRDTGRVAPHSMKQVSISASVPSRSSNLVQSESLSSLASSQLSSSSYLHVHQGSDSADDHHFERHTTSDAPSHARRFRKSESMKRLVDAGLREIKRIGQRVSHGGHEGSVDER